MNQQTDDNTHVAPLDLASDGSSNFDSNSSPHMKQLTEEDLIFLNQREKIITTGVKASIAAAKALFEIRTYGGGILWNTNFRSFEAYCQSKWGYGKSHSYRLSDAGELIAAIEHAGSPKGERLPDNESQIRPILEGLPKSERVEFWKKITKNYPTEKITGSLIRTQIRASHPKNIRGSVIPHEKRHLDRARRAFTVLQEALARVPFPTRFDDPLASIARLISQTNLDL